LAKALIDGDAMPDDYISFAADVAEYIEIAAIIVIALGVVVAVISGVITLVRVGGDPSFTTFKRLMARGLLVGLDLLIAADIIKTITLEPTLENIAGLGLLVVIRTFLSWALVLEVEGVWPWQKRPGQEAET
jgi:uncharacterized membrane protein